MLTPDEYYPNPHLQIDHSYLWHWVDRLGLQGELQYVLQAAGGS